MRMWRLLSIALLADLTAAQDDPVTAATAELLARAKPLLASDEAADVAWGAHLASRFELADAALPLRDALRRWRQQDGKAARQVRLHLIDALWATRAELANDDYAFLLDDPLTRVPAFLVAARNPTGNSQVLAQAATHCVCTDDYVPMAAGGLLVDHDVKVATFARHLLDVAECRLEVTVVDDAKTPSGGWNSAVGRGGSGGLLTRAKGFPPLVWHTLSPQYGGVGGSPGANTIRSGRERDTEIWRKGADGTSSWLPLPPGGRDGDPAIAHKRTTTPGIEHAKLATTAPQPAPKAWQALLWLERMARMNLPYRTRTEIRWRDEASFREGIATARAALQAQLQPLVDNLVASEWLPADANREFSLPVVVVVVDGRGDRTVPLPELERTGR